MVSINIFLVLFGLGLSLVGDFQSFVGRFFALQGEKTTHNNDKIPRCRNPELDEGQAKAPRAKILFF